MSDENEKPRNRWEVSGVFIPGCLLIGMGIGWAFDHLVVGLFIGMGVGFLLMGISRLVIRN